MQIEIFRAIEEGDLPQDEKQQWLERVEDRLLTISELYSEFAEPLGLLEIILLIVRLSPSTPRSDVDFRLLAVPRLGSPRPLPRYRYLGSNPHEGYVLRPLPVSARLADTPECAAQEAQPDDPLDAVAAKVTQLGARFHSSDVSFPLGAPFESASSLSLLTFRCFSRTRRPPRAIQLRAQGRGSTGVGCVRDP